MSGEFLLKALALISGLTTLTVEAIKKLLNDKQVQYSSNLLAAIVAVILTLCVSVAYVLYFAVPLSVQVIISVIALIYLSFLCATIGFDKIKQLIEQMGK
jgi:hypothetical protein